MGKLVIDLGALTRNYRQIQTMTGAGCNVAAVVKANAYGCGLAAVAGALHAAGAQEFFVATLPEALELRTIIDEASRIYVLNGFNHTHGDLYMQENIIPVLSSMPEIQSYVALAAETGHKLPAIIHIDTGMNRLGLESADIENLASAPEVLAGLDLHYVMSHFACADEQDHSMNAAQYEAFKQAAKTFPGVKMSLANSSGVFRSHDYYFDMVRPGMCLYGLNPLPEADNPMHPVVKLDVPVLQIRQAQKGETCGYGATHRFEKPANLAVVSMGYADGFLRSLSNKGVLYWKDYKCPVRGRVSMDLTIVDLSAVPDNELPGPGDMLEVIGTHQSADDVAEACGTIGYEILTSLSRRYQRIYKD